MHGAWVPTIGAKGPRRCSPAGNRRPIAWPLSVASARSAAVSSLMKPVCWRATTDSPRTRPAARPAGRPARAPRGRRSRRGRTGWPRWQPGYRASARNIVHYWAIRQTDLRDLQHRLAAFGLSSLGRSEPHVEATLRLVRSAVVAMLEDTLAAARRRPPSARTKVVSCCAAAPSTCSGRCPPTGRPASWSPCRRKRRPNPDLVRRLVERGMNVARINCAHDDPTAWRAMADHVRHAGAVTGAQLPRRHGPCRAPSCARADPARAACRQASAQP